MSTMSEPLKVSLTAYHSDALHEMADILGLRPDRQPARKNWFVTELSKIIPRLARSEKFLLGLSDPERALLAIVLEAGSVATLIEVARPLLLAGMVRVEGVPSTESQPVLQELVLGLMRKGLLINLAQPYGAATMRTWARHHRFGIAPEVQSALPKTLLSLPSHAAGSWLTQDAPPVTHGESLQQFMRRLFFVWTELRRAPARQLKSGGIGKRDLRRLAQTLGFDEKEDDLNRVCNLYDMLVALNLVARDGNSITAVDNDAATLFWHATPVRQLHDLGRAYARMAGGMPLDEGDAGLNSYIQGYGVRPFAQIREDIYKGLGQLSSEGWISFPFLVTFLNGSLPGALLLGEGAKYSLLENLRWYGGHYRADIEHRLERLEVRVITSALVELAGMGIVSIGYVKSGAGATAEPEAKPIAIRVTPVVRAYREDAGGRSSATDQPWQVILQPDFQLLAMGPVPLRVLSNLERVARHEKLTDSVVTFRVSRDSVYEALRRGETAESVCGYLQEATQQPLPQNVSRSIDEWCEQHERIIVRRQVSLIQVDTVERLDRLFDDADARRLLHRLGDCVAWVDPADTAQLEVRLVELELLPAHSQAPDADLPHSLEWRDGDLVSRFPLPSLYVTGVLNRVAEPHAGRWRVTAQTVQVAVLAGMPSVDIVALLEQMTGGPLPGDWARKIKAWGKHYGDGKSAQVRLLRVDREGALEELRRADPQLRRWLRPLPGAEDIAVVEAPNWEDAVGLLASWGVGIEDGQWW